MKLCREGRRLVAIFLVVLVELLTRHIDWIRELIHQYAQLLLSAYILASLIFWYSSRWIFRNTASLHLSRTLLDVPLHDFEANVAAVLLCVRRVLTLLCRCLVYEIDRREVHVMT